MKINIIDNWRTNNTPEQIDLLLQNLKMGTREWVRKGGELNFCIGCQNNCAYCYARSNANHFNQRKFDDWERVVIKFGLKIPKKIKHDPTKYDFMMQSTSDIPESEDGWTEWLRLAKEILKRDYTLLITTKPKLDVIKNIHDELEQYRNNITFRFTITTKNENMIRLMEPNAPSYLERVNSLKFAHLKKYNTSVSLEPLLDNTPHDIIYDIQDYLSPIQREKDIGTIWVGLLKTQYTPIQYRETHGLTDLFKKIRQQQNFSNVLDWYKQIYDHPRIVMKESVKKMMLKHNIRVKLY